MNGDGFPNLSLLPVQVAENHVDFESVCIETGGLGELIDRQINLVCDQEVEAEQIVRRLAGTSPVEQLSVAQLVALPRLADGQADE